MVALTLEPGQGKRIRRFRRSNDTDIVATSAFSVSQAPTSVSAGRPGGRPTKLTPELTERVTSLIEQGNPPHRAVQMVGISERAFYSWMAKGRRQERGKFVQFVQAIEASKARCEAKLISVVMNGALSDPRLALNVLSRMNRKDWAATVKVEPDPPPPQERLDKDHAFARAVIENKEASVLAHELLYVVRTGKSLRPQKP